MPNMKITKIENGLSVVVQPSQRWLSTAVVVIWLATITSQIAPNDGGDSSSGATFFLALNFFVFGIYVTWQLASREVILLKKDVIVIQRMLGPLKLGAPIEVDRKSIINASIRERRFMTKSREYVKRRVVLNTDTGDIGLSIAVSSEDGEKLRKIILRT